MAQKFDIEMPKSLTEIVAQRVRQAIIDGEFALGQMISEETLAESFGVSRTPVRDALTLLQTTGLVDIRSKRGSFVFQPDEKDVQAICDFRAMLELHGAMLSRALQREATVAGLQAIFEQMQAAIAADDDVAYGRCDSAFHEALFAHCGNAYVVNSYALVSGKIAALRTHMSRQFSNARSVSMEEHAQIIQCVDTGDFTRLEQLLNLHVGRTVEAFRLASSAAQDASPAPLKLRA
ncbi:DNA-binding GntR family transcriptional regulator [Rhodoferax ferrireducens]|uniref:DNA-binding GntR family transcriptional regulator n=1 Tax=Rhodoferax ferrireducens TaxID=192843 RepID=A0ABU2CEF1_9BURK|nr:GntR family transcriptional regulator [Rhodoferax ferrireducens]MDR7379710.1 DNA-binding GntR family transcriptional regulator [Rhodoferax ferrireducens]